MCGIVEEIVVCSFGGGVGRVRRGSEWQHDRRSGFREGGCMEGAGQEGVSCWEGLEAAGPVWLRFE